MQNHYVLWWWCLFGQWSNKQHQREILEQNIRWHLAQLLYLGSELNSGFICHPFVITSPPLVICLPPTSSSAQQGREITSEASAKQPVSRSARLAPVTTSACSDSSNVLWTQCSSFSRRNRWSLALVIALMYASRIAIINSVPLARDKAFPVRLKSENHLVREFCRTTTATLSPLLLSALWCPSGVRFARLPRKALF